MWTGIFTGIFLFFALSIALLSRAMKSATQIPGGVLEMPDEAGSQRVSGAAPVTELTALADVDQSTPAYAACLMAKGTDS